LFIFKLIGEENVFCGFFLSAKKCLQFFADIFFKKYSQNDTLFRSYQLNFIFLKVIDGATLARFSNKVKQLCENPAILLAELR